MIQKQPPRSVLRNKCSENVQQNYRGTASPQNTSGGLLLMIHQCFLQLPGNIDGYDVERRKLKVPINARYIRINPSAWRNGICMRVEFYGCSIEEGISISFAVINRRTLEDLLRSKCIGKKNEVF